ncbi:helix-turn-helix transcriptional regulator [Sphingomonas sp. SUN039]|uniref:helix-turn-helix transcriptional regulator n=1 Tax=Sphingomonas sp. SUN039 TaxID=2937787 RepID=UPI0021640493|nr:helix-turn-helix transcriptional regulator [Sphingomonas sp. SUN039]UVO54974.1 helix-turn-helix transcriptional regulator [Sphingomonas sp. SUN039]
MTIAPVSVSETNFAGGMTVDAALIDRVYECSVVPELWPDILDDVAGQVDARGGLLFSARRTLDWTASKSLTDVFQTYVADGWFANCDRRVCIMSQAQPSFFVEHDFWSESDLDRTPIYRDFFRPRGLGWSAGTGLKMPTGDNVVFSIERDFERGPIERDYVDHLNALRPHLARSAFLTARLGMQRIAGATETLTAIGLPAVALDAGGAVVEANELAQGLTGHLRWGSQNQLVLTDKRARQWLHDGLAALGDPTATVPSSFPVRNADDVPELVAHLLPVRRSAQDIFGGGFALLFLTTLGGKRAPDAALLRSLFDLTPAEARVAAGLAEGQSLEEIALASGIAFETVRKQLRGVFEKTGCNRQAEVATLLASVKVGEGA